MISLYGLLPYWHAARLYNEIPKFRCNVYLTLVNLIKCTYVVFYAIMASLS